MEFRWGGFPGEWLRAIVRALFAGRRTPQIVNTDQGSSMDGRGRCMDNVSIERRWRSLRYEAIYLYERTECFGPTGHRPTLTKGRTLEVADKPCYLTAPPPV